MPKYMQSVVLSTPTKVGDAPSKFVAAARHKGFHMDLTLSHTKTSWHSDSSTWFNGMDVYIEKWEKKFECTFSVWQFENIVQHGFFHSNGPTDHRVPRMLKNPKQSTFSKDNRRRSCPRNRPLWCLHDSLIPQIFNRQRWISIGVVCAAANSFRVCMFEIYECTHIWRIWLSSKKLYIDICLINYWTEKNPILLYPYNNTSHVLFSCVDAKISNWDSCSYPDSRTMFFIKRSRHFCTHKYNINILTENECDSVSYANVYILYSILCDVSSEHLTQAQPFVEILPHCTHKSQADTFILWRDFFVRAFILEQMSTQEKNGLYPVITTNLAMETKTIAYGIISHKHQKAQRVILGATNSEVLERIVRDKTHSGETSV